MLDANKVHLSPNSSAPRHSTTIGELALSASDLAPGRFRLIALATGERLDLNDPNLGRPDGLELWDRAARAVSRRNAPTARCLFPLCQGAPLVLKVRRDTGTRYAAHFPGEGQKVDHTVATRDDSSHRRLVEIWGEVLHRAGYPAARERPQGRRAIVPDLLVSAAPQPTSIEVQLTMTKDHLDRTRKAARLGITAVWNSGPGVELKDRVPELRFTTNIADVLTRRHPQDLRMLGVRHISWEREIGGRDFRPKPTPAPMPMGAIAEQVPAAALVPITYGKARLLVPTDHAAAYAPYAAAVVDRESPTQVPLGDARRHVELASKARHQQTAIAVGLNLDDQPTFTHGPGSLQACVICGEATFRRRWNMMIHPGCEATLW